MMTEKEVFAANLRRIVEESPLSLREIADEAGITQKTLSRWLQDGVKKPDRRTRKPLLELCRMFSVELDELWVDGQACPCGEYGLKVKKLFERWEKLGIEYESVARWIDRWYSAAEVSERFQREEPDLAEIVKKVKSLKSDGELHAYLEKMVRDWQLDETAAYKRLIETTLKFLAAALPRDPDQLGAWFKQVHPRRWAKMLARRKLDNEGELVAFLRHMMEEGLSAHEAYEGLIRLSN
jgi:transcriptional regulator with XRE-family HTH domain